MRQILSVECAKHEGVHTYQSTCRDWYPFVAIDMAAVEMHVMSNMVNKMEFVEDVLHMIGNIALSGATKGTGYIFHAEKVREQLYRLLTESKNHV